MRRSIAQRNVAIPAAFASRLPFGLGKIDWNEQFQCVSEFIELVALFCLISNSQAPNALRFIAVIRPRPDWSESFKIKAETFFSLSPLGIASWQQPNEAIKWLIAPASPLSDLARSQTITGA
jgi:hypothetical protein